MEYTHIGFGIIRRNSDKESFSHAVEKVSELNRLHAELKACREALEQAKEACGKANACASLPDHTRELCRDARLAIYKVLAQGASS